MYTLDAYTANRINELAASISTLQAELDSLKAWAYLDELAQTATTKLVDYLAEYYDTEYTKAFESDAFRRGYSSEYFNATNTVKRAIHQYKRQADTRKSPVWASQAIKAAAIVDAYNQTLYNQ